MHQSTCSLTHRCLTSDSLNLPKVTEENQLQHSITYQQFFRMYKKLAGMTGTASAEAGELFDVYGLEVLPIPTHRPILRIDYPPRIFLSRNEKHAYCCFELVLQALYGVETYRKEAAEKLLDTAERAGGAGGSWQGGG